MHGSILTYSSTDVCLSRAWYHDRQDGSVSRTLLLDVVDDILGEREQYRWMELPGNCTHERRYNTSFNISNEECFQSRTTAPNIA